MFALLVILGTRFPNRLFGRGGLPNRLFGRTGVPYSLFGGTGVPIRLFGGTGMPIRLFGWTVVPIMLTRLFLSLFVFRGTGATPLFAFLVRFRFLFSIFTGARTKTVLSCPSA